MTDKEKCKQLAQLLMKQQPPPSPNSVLERPRIQLPIQPSTSSMGTRG